MMALALIAFRFPDTVMLSLSDPSFSTSAIAVKKSSSIAPLIAAVRL
jgi:hypothetical protein